MSKTIGEKKVRTEFNPSNDGIIDQIKQKSAELINLINDLNLSDCPGDHPDKDEGDVSSDGILIDIEFDAAKKIAIQSIETGCMWAVKGATVKL